MRGLYPLGKYGFFGAMLHSFNGTFRTNLEIMKKRILGKQCHKDIHCGDAFETLFLPFFSQHALLVIRNNMWLRLWLVRVLNPMVPKGLDVTLPKTYI